MFAYHIQSYRYILVCFLLVLVSACGTRTVLDDNRKTDVNYRLQNKQVTQAHQLGQQGDYFSAAKAFWHLSKGIQAPYKQRYQMTAVEYLIQGNLIERATKQLKQIRPPANDNTTFNRMALAKIEIQIASQQASQALEALRQISIVNLSAVLQKKHFELQALAYESLHEYQQAADKRIEFDVLVRNTNRQLYNQKMLWRDLLNMTPIQLTQATANRSKDSQAWYALGLIAKTTAKTNYPKALSRWQQRYPQHPVRHQVLSQLTPVGTHQQSTTISRANLNQQAHIALLLPQTGGLKAASQAIQDAFLAGWSTSEPRLPPVKIYDVSDSANIVSVYNEAVNSGAQVVIGPLRKGALTTLSQTYGHFPVPTVFLNRLPDASAHSNLFQFSLSPEEEAVQIAQQARADGQQMATALIPDNKWGRRLLDAFQQSWQANGGLFLGHAYYVEQDLAQAVREVVNNYPQSDMLFIAAPPQDARRLVPQIRYALSSKKMINLNKINLPLYATSHVYTGNPSPSLDRDLDGVTFVDMPWVINAEFNEGFPDNNAQQHNQVGNKRLFAFGLDAYQITHYLYQANNNPSQLHINGATGQLSLDNQGLIHRQLNTGYFYQGRVVLR